MTNRQFKEFVRGTGHVTFAEIAPDPKDYPGALRHRPAIDLDWFNADGGKEQVSTAAAINVSGASAPVSSSDMAPPAAPSDAAAESATAQYGSAPFWGRLASSPSLLRASGLAPSRAAPAGLVAGPHLYGGPPVPWSGPALFNAASTVRATRVAASGHGSHRPVALPALNP